MKNCSAGTTGPAIANDDDEDDKPVLVNEPSDPFREKRFQLYIKNTDPAFRIHDQPVTFSSTSSWHLQKDPTHMADSANLALRGSPGPAGTTTKSAERFSFWRKARNKFFFQSWRSGATKFSIWEWIWVDQWHDYVVTVKNAISQIHHQESIHQNASATSSCFFELSWEPEIQKFIYNQLSECIFEAQLRSHPLCFATPRCWTVCPPIVSACRFSQGGGVLVNCLRRFVREGRPRCGASLVGGWRQPHWKNVRRSSKWIMSPGFMETIGFNFNHVSASCINLNSELQKYWTNGNPSWGNETWILKHGGTKTGLRNTWLQSFKYGRYLEQCMNCYQPYILPGENFKFSRGLNLTKT